MKSLVFLLLLLLSTLSLIAQPARDSIGTTGTESSSTDGKELDGISFTITYSAHESTDYSVQAKAMADALTAAGAKVRLQQYNSKTREGIFGYYGKTEADKIDSVRKLVSKTLDVKFEHSKAFDESGANPNRMIMIYLIRNKPQ